MLTKQDKIEIREICKEVCKEEVQLLRVEFVEFKRQVDKRFDAVDARFDRLEENIEARFDEFAILIQRQFAEFAKILNGAVIELKENREKIFAIEAKMVKNHEPRIDTLEKEVLQLNGALAAA